MCVIVTVLVNVYLWRSLPYPEAHRLYNVEYARPSMAFPIRTRQGRLAAAQ